MDENFISPQRSFLIELARKTGTVRFFYRITKKTADLKQIQQNITQEFGCVKEAIILTANITYKKLSGYSNPSGIWSYQVVLATDYKTTQVILNYGSPALVCNPLQKQFNKTRFQKDYSKHSILYK